MAQYAGQPFEDWAYCEVRNLADVRFYSWTRNEVGDDAESLVVSVSNLDLPLTISYSRTDLPCGS